MHCENTIICKQHVKVNFASDVLFYIFLTSEYVGERLVGEGSGIC